MLATAIGAPLVIWSTDTLGRYTFIDGAALAKIGMTCNQLIGLHYSAIAPGETMDRAMKAVLKGEAGQVICDYAGLAFEAHMEPAQ